MIETFDVVKREKPGWEEEIRLTQEAIKAANQMNPKPRFFVVCGDLVDAMPLSPYKEPQIVDFKKCFSQLDNDIPLVCVCGNHDVGDTPTADAIEGYRNSFGDDFFSFVCGGVLFIVLNSQYYQDASLVQELAEQQDNWLDQLLNEAKDNQYKHIVVFQHIPWFLRDPDEAKEYFNIEESIRQKMLSKFYDAGVRAIFCGHYHRNAGGFYKDLELIVTSAIGKQLGQDKSGFRIVRVLEDSIEHKYYSLDEVPTDIQI